MTLLSQMGMFVLLQINEPTVQVYVWYLTEHSIFQYMYIIEYGLQNPVIDQASNVPNRRGTMLLDRPGHGARLVASNDKHRLLRTYSNPQYPQQEKHRSLRNYSNPELQQRDNHKLPRTSFLSGIPMGRQSLVARVYSNPHWAYSCTL